LARLPQAAGFRCRFRLQEGEKIISYPTKRQFIPFEYSITAWFRRFDTLPGRPSTIPLTHSIAEILSLQLGSFKNDYDENLGLDEHYFTGYTFFMLPTCL
jgi:hypothetical protein